MSEGLGESVSADRVVKTDSCGRSPNVGHQKILIYSYIMGLFTVDKS
jgi:hypothetical protein